MQGDERGKNKPRNTLDSTGAWQLRGPGIAPLIVLTATVLMLGWLFFQMVRPMILTLFLAGILAMLVYPWHEKLLKRLHGRDWLSATIFTLSFSALVFVPLGLGLFYGVRQAMQLVRTGTEDIAHSKEMLEESALKQRLASLLEILQTRLNVNVDQLEAGAVDFGKSAAKSLYEKSVGFAGDLPGFVVSIFIFLFAFYFFLQDGRRLVSSWQRLTPMEASHDAVLREEFTRVCRAVVWGTLLAAVAQGILFGVGLLVMELFVHTGTMKWIFLLSLLATMAAMVPFVGASVVWVPLALYFLWMGQWAAGISLLVYGIAVISMADNVIKIYALRDGASLHPLLVFISVFGGIQMFGVLGMFIGPIIGAVLFALLRVLKQELLRRQIQFVQPGT